MNSNTTICALSTPPGIGGIAIIRISGPHSSQIMEKLFSPCRKSRSRESHKMVYGQLIDPDSGAVVDQVLCCYMKGPRTYTREDVVEFHCHGGGVVARMVLELCLRQGAVMAQPGEFTRRAFMAGRIDLSQAEAVAELIDAGSHSEAHLAARQLAGGIKDRIDGITGTLVELLARIEVAIDFPDEEIEILDPLVEAENLEKGVLNDLRQLVKNYEDGRIYREGIKLALVGRPNVGKSSLLNRLLQQDKAIVTPIPGTTRDVIEAQAVISGMPVELFDTAGLESDSADEVEAEGQKRARKVMDEADLVLMVIDGSRAIKEADRDIHLRAQRNNILVLINKIDLVPHLDPGPIQTFLSSKNPVCVSALTGEGIPELKEAVFNSLQPEGATGKPAKAPEIVPNLRHKMAIEEGEKMVRNTLDALRDGAPMEVVALEVGLALEVLGRITGKTTPEDVLDKIFSRFCLGK